MKALTLSYNQACDIYRYKKKGWSAAKIRKKVGRTCDNQDNLERRLLAVPKSPCVHVILNNKEEYFIYESGKVYSWRHSRYVKYVCGFYLYDKKVQLDYFILNAYKPAPTKESFVWYKDGNPKNLAVKNLTWVKVNTGQSLSHYMLMSLRILRKSKKKAIIKLAGKIFICHIDGRVIRKKTGKSANTYSTSLKYYFVSCGKSTSRFCVLTHRLLLSVFKRLPVNSKELGRHLDGNKQNNHIDNLEWGTHQDNSDDLIKYGTPERGKVHNNARLTEKEAKKLIKQWLAYDKSMLNFAQAKSVEYGITETSVYNLLRGNTWKHLKRPEKKGWKPFDNRVYS
jgi:hypothetical protein